MRRPVKPIDIFRRAVLALLLLLAGGVWGATSERDLVEYARAHDAEWVEWSMPLAPGVKLRSCCHDGIEEGVCRLGRSGGFYSGDDQLEEISTYRVFARVADRAIVDLQFYDDLCRVDTSSESVVVIDLATPVAVEILEELVGSERAVSVDALGAMAFADEPTVLSRLEGHLSSAKDEDLRGTAAFYLSSREGAGALPLLKRRIDREPSADVREKIVFAMSLSGSSQARRMLAGISRSDSDPDVRADALFWLGQTWGREAMPAVERALDDRDEEVRERAVFVISQIPGEEATRKLGELARSSSDREIRKKALFWLSQRASAEAAEIIEGLIQSEEDEEILEAAVFAVSQLSHDEGVPLLIRLAREHASNEVRERAIFWLGQSGDPRAIGVLEEIALRNDG